VILLLDNYDSFTYNLAHLFGELGAEVIVRRNDAIDAAGAARLAPSQLVISPGPGRPADAGASLEIIRRLAPGTPTLGICLGHQAIVEAFGGQVTAARTLVHGKACIVRHDGRGLFSGLPDELEVGRFHALAATENAMALDKIRASGKTTVYTPTAAEIDEWRRALMPVHHEMAARVGQPTIDAVYKAAGFVAPA